MLIAGSISMDKPAPRHDFRIGQIPNNVDPNLIRNNIVLVDNLKGQTIKEYTNKKMQKYIDEYNEKQTRENRKIKCSYTDWHMKDKNMMKGVPDGQEPDWAYEFVLCYGNHEDYWHEYFDPNTPKERKCEMYNEAVSAYKLMISEFSRRYPHLDIVYCVLHFDEPFGSGHAHLCVQAHAQNYSRGVSDRVSISKCLEQDGFEHIHNIELAKENGGFQMERLFKDFRHNVINPLLMSMGHEVKEEVHGRKHESPTIFVEHMKQLDARAKRVQEMEVFTESLKRIDELSSEIVYGKTKQSMVQKVIPPRFGKEEMVVLTSNDFNSLCAVTEHERIKRDIETKNALISNEQKKILKQMEIGADKTLLKENERLTAELNSKQYELRALRIKNENLNSIILDLRQKLNQTISYIRAVAPVLANNIINRIIEPRERQHERTR